MAIVKMKKLRVIAMASRRRELLRQLQRLGCVEIREPETAGEDWSGLLERESSRLAETRAALADVDTALAAVKKYADVREGMFPQRRAVTGEELFSGRTAEAARSAAERVSGLTQTLSQLQGEESRLLAKRASLAPWQGLDMPLEQAGTAHTAFLPGVCPAAADLGTLRQALSETAGELLEISSDKQQRYCLLICHRADEELALERLGADRDGAVYVGDSQVDVDTARAAGMPCIAVTWGFRTREDLVKAGAETLADTPEALLKLLRA